jgi:SAM-dependent methyltransferase
VTPLPHLQIDLLESHLIKIGKPATQANAEELQGALIELEHLGELLVGRHRAEDPQRALVVRSGLPAGVQPSVLWRFRMCSGWFVRQISHDRCLQFGDRTGRGNFGRSAPGRILPRNSAGSQTFDGSTAAVRGVRFVQTMKNTGSLEDLRELVAGAVAAGACARMVLSRPRRGGAAAGERVTVRPVELAGGTRYQFATRSGRQETHENVEPGEVAGRVLRLFGEAFEHCHVLTTEADYTARRGRDGGVRITTSPATHVAAAAGHNRPKEYLIPEGTPCAFLAEIGVMTPAGQVRKSRYGKFRQVNRFLELVNDVVEHLPAEGPLRVVDYGCGKSYLTFALYHLLTEIRGREVQITGLDRNADVIHDCQRIAGRLGCRGLEFFAGDITTQAPAGPMDLAVSLHACDTATDDALAHAIRGMSRVILAVPCCQHELAPQLATAPLEPLLKYGLLRERFAALLTDSLRALMLEIHGYRTQVVEFVDLEHTAKNVLLRAVRQPFAAVQIAERRRAYAELKAQFGLGELHLDRVLAGGGRVDSK